MTKKKKILSDTFNFISDIRKFLFHENIEDVKYRVKAQATIKKQIQSSIMFGFAIIAIAVLFFGVWGGLAPLDSASVANGHIVLSGNRKAVQHLEGGIVEKIFIKDGDVVFEGQELILLSQSKPKLEYQMTLAQLRTLIAAEYRLIAEINNQNYVNFDDPILDQSIPEVKIIVNNQISLFMANRNWLTKRIEISKQRIAQLKETEKSYRMQIKSNNEQLQSLNDQKERSQKLLDSGLITKTDMTNVMDRYHQISMSNSQLLGNIASSIENIGEQEAILHSTTHEYRSKLEVEYRENHAKLEGEQEKCRYTKEVLDRTIIRAPASGIVNNLIVHTIGAVIGQGTKLLDIIPEDDNLIAEVKMLTQDINNIHVGNKVKIQLTPFKQRRVPKLEGEVIYVSSDKVEYDGRPTENPLPSYYLVRIKIDPESLEKLTDKVQLQPGMPVTAFIVKGETTFLEYMMAPITDSFHRAFKEQ